MFDWMGGPLLEGIYPDELYNGMPIPDDKKGYVMKYNKVIGLIRLRQVRANQRAEGPPPVRAFSPGPLSPHTFSSQVRANQCTEAMEGCGACSDLSLVLQQNTRKNGEKRQRQFVDYCYPEYDPLVPNELPFGPTELHEAGTLIILHLINCI